MIAVGAGGLVGQGWLEGTQSQLQFLPTPHTDFIFAVVGEEFGFVGVVTVIILYLVIALRSLETARRARDRLGIYLVFGVLSMFVFQTLYNVPKRGRRGTELLRTTRARSRRLMRLDRCLVLTRKQRKCYCQTNKSP